MRASSESTPPFESSAIFSALQSEQRARALERPPGRLRRVELNIYLWVSPTSDSGKTYKTSVRVAPSGSTRACVRAENGDGQHTGVKSGDPGLTFQGSSQHTNSGPHRRTSEPARGDTRYQMSGSGRKNAVEVIGRVYRPISWLPPGHDPGAGGCVAHVLALLNKPERLFALVSRRDILAIFGSN